MFSFPSESCLVCQESSGLTGKQMQPYRSWLPLVFSTSLLSYQTQARLDPPVLHLG